VSLDQPQAFADKETGDVLSEDSQEQIKYFEDRILGLITF
jgi:hypothetical protein